MNKRSIIVSIKELKSNNHLLMHLFIHASIMIFHVYSSFDLLKESQKKKPSPVAYKQTTPFCLINCSIIIPTLFCNANTLNPQRCMFTIGAHARYRLPCSFSDSFPFVGMENSVKLSLYPID